MKPTLGGATFIMNGNKYDYHFKETIQCLKELCDSVVICAIPTDDGTIEDLQPLLDDKTKLILVDQELWEATKSKGSERLSFFSNIAIANLKTDYLIYIQCDECLHQDSFPAVRKAIETGKEAFMITRLNLWRDPYSMLNVKGERNPCSPQVIRLTKSQYRCISDGESINAQCVFDYVNDIVMYHSGYIRRKDVMKSKIIHLQTEVFQMSDYDKKLDKHELFQPMDYFELHELIPIPKPLPKWIQKWSAERTYVE
jgi:hypothetical protein